MEYSVKIAEVCGLCAGCMYAITQAQNHAATKSSVTLFKEIVHNKNVNNLLKSQGVNFCEDLTSLPKNSTIILRAHGEPKQTIEYLVENGYNFVDCTCINVKKIHEQVALNSELGKTIIIVGKYGKTSGKVHPEIEGTIGWCKTAPVLIEDEDDINKLNGISNTQFYLVCQTTFNIEKADKIIAEISKVTQQKSLNNTLEINKSICMAQRAINVSSKILAENCNIMIVVGGKNSSNSIELARSLSKITKTIFIEDITQIFSELEHENIKLSPNIKIGLTAGASTLKSELETLKTMLEDKLKELYND